MNESKEFKRKEVEELLLPTKNHLEFGSSDCKHGVHTSSPVSQTRGRWQRFKTMASIITLSVLSAALLLYRSVPEVTADSTKSNLCLTPGCVHAASDILYNLSPDYKSIDPCANFEEFVCGGWKDRHDLREDQGRAFTGSIMIENTQMLVKNILEAPYPKNSTHSYFSPRELSTANSTADEQNFEKMKAVYDACLDEAAIKNIGVAPLMNIIREVERTAGADDNAVRDTIILLAKYRVFSLIYYSIGADDKAPDEVVVSVGAPGEIGLPSKERYEDDSLVKKYEDTLDQVLSALFPDHNKSGYAASAIVDLEKKLAAASPDTQERTDITKMYNPYSLSDAAALAPQIDLAGIISTFAPRGVNVDRLIVSTPKYMTALADILSETPKSTLQGYFIWKVVQSFAPYVEADAVKPCRRFSNQLLGIDPDATQERWRTCVRDLDSVGWILSRFYIEKAFSAKAKKFGDTIVSDIKNEFSKKLKITEWMEQSVIEKALEKVHNIVQKIGYPTKSPDITNPEELRDFYQSLIINSTTFFANEVSIREFYVNYTWSFLGKPTDRNVWVLTAPTVNAYYNPPGNEIVFPAGIMQFPVFDVDVPAYLSYGSFGSIAGHELSHAFDSTGRHYDQNGNYTDWWTNSTVKAFQKRANCFVSEYNNFTIPGPDDKPLHINGLLTLGENIADAGGLSASFQAWKMRTKEMPDQDLPGLDFFSHDQLFFVNFANWYCGKIRKEEAINLIYIDPHAPMWTRILGPMANSREFKKAFQCESKKPLCELW